MKNCSGAKEVKKYLPTKYFFDEKRWLKQEQSSGQYYRQSGVVIGNLLRDVDEEFQGVLNEHGSLSEVEIIVFQANYTAKLFKDIENGTAPESVNQIFEVISDGTMLLLKTAYSEFSGYKPLFVYESLLRLASERIYLEEKWKKVENSRLALEEFTGELKFRTVNNELDFGEVIAIERFQDHMNQLNFEAKQDRDFKDNRLKAIPSILNISMDGIDIEFSAVDHNVDNQSYTLMCQTKFYYKKFLDVNFKNYDEISILDLSAFWLVFSNLAFAFLNTLKSHVDKGIYYAFSKKELIDILAYCTGFTDKKAEQLIELFTNKKEMLTESDLYIRPLYQIDETIHLCIPTLLTGQFTRVVDYYVNTEVAPAVKSKKSENKGRFFELDFVDTLEEQIRKNKPLKNIFCKVLNVGLKQRPGKDNEEIDIILRIGETYLIIEAKSFTYRIGSSGLKNNIETITESNLERKKQFFIDDYERFKKSYDPTANFVFDEAKVLCCYLSSAPHCVGIRLNGYPVVDPSIIERYFGNSNFVMVDQDKGIKNFCFYKNELEAEKNLKRYLDELPQLSHYRNCFSYARSNFQRLYKGKKVIFDEPYFDFGSGRIEGELLKTWSLADRWHAIK